MKPGSRWAAYHWALMGLLLLGWALRLPPVLNHRLHPDEALYGYWGLLIGRGRDPWLASVPVYKPPLLPYLMAGVQGLFGGSELTVRLLGAVAGLLMVGLTAALADALYRERWTALTAAVGVALSPLAISFSSTAFPDPLMVAFGLAACVAAVRGRPRWAGLLAGLSFATKQTGLVWIPLALGVSLTRSPNSKAQNLKSEGRGPKSEVRSPNLHHWSLVVCFSLVVGLVFAWDAARVVQGAESFWRVGVTGYGGLRLIWPQELWTRLRRWIGVARFLFVSPVVNGALLAGLPLLVWSALTRCRCTREGFTDLLLIFFSLIYFLLHWLTAFPIWDRYLLPLVPVLAVLLGRTISFAVSWLQSATRNLQSTVRNSPFVICHLLFVIFLAGPALNAARSRYPIGDDRAAYDGIDQIAAFLSRLPEGSVVYHRWLGWHYHYYLFDAPVYLAYWPTPAWLAQDVQVFGAQEPRYITLPSWESSARVERALADVGYTLQPALTTVRRDETPSFTVYRIRGSGE